MELELAQTKLQLVEAECKIQVAQTLPFGSLKKIIWASVRLVQDELLRADFPAIPLPSGPGAPSGSGSQRGPGGQEDLVQPNAQLHQNSHRHPGQRDHLTLLGLGSLMRQPELERFSLSSVTTEPHFSFFLLPFRPNRTTDTCTDISAFQKTKTKKTTTFVSTPPSSGHPYTLVWVLVSAGPTRGGR